jgi:hypothetical protein
MHLKQEHPHLQVILSVGGGASAETFPGVAANGLLRDTFARSARGLVEASGLDGIDSEAFHSPPRTAAEELTAGAKLTGSTPTPRSRASTFYRCWQRFASTSRTTATF